MRIAHVALTGCAVCLLGTGGIGPQGLLDSPVHSCALVQGFMPINCRVLCLARALQLLFDCCAKQQELSLAARLGSSSLAVRLG